MWYYFYTLTADNDPENIRYVGVTTRTLEQRLSGHRYNAKHDNKRSQPVHKWMWSKMKEGVNISINWLDECEEDMWESREKYWVQYYKDQGFKLLNVSEGGVGVITKEMRNASRIQRSIDAHKKAVCCLHPETKELIAVYDSVSEATKAMGFKSRSAIGNALKGKKTIMSGGYYWVYKSDYDAGTYTLREIDPYVHVTTPMVYRFDLNGQLIDSYHGVQAAAKAGGALSGNASALKIALTNKSIYSDCYWSFDNVIDISEFENPYKYVEIDSNNMEICKYKTQSEIKEKYNMSDSHVCVKIKEGSLFGKNKIIKI